MRNFYFVIFLALSICLGAEERPNIVLIMADDMGKETLGAHGGLDYKTPVLDKIGSEGLTFDHCYSLPICTPSRVKIMTGKYGFRNYRQFGLLPTSEVTFGNALQKAGYATCITGKWQLGGDHDQLKNFGWDEYCLTNGVKPKNPQDKPLIQGRERYWRTANVIANGKYYQPSCHFYGPDMVNEYACNFIKREKDKPFFLYYPMILPHSPWGPTPHSKDGDKSGAKVSEVHFFKDNIEYIDHLVGNVVKALEESGQRENTLLIFTGDNGSGYPVPVTKTNEDMRRIVSLKGWGDYEEIIVEAGEQSPKSSKGIQEGPITNTTYGVVPGRKNLMLRDGTGVPCVMEWPKYNKIYDQHRLDDLIDFSDFFATFAELAGVEKEFPSDGVSFASRLKNDEKNSREFVFCHYWKSGRDPLGARDAIHNGKYKIYNNGDFFDLEKDSDEKNAIAVSEMNEGQLAERGKLMNQYYELRGMNLPVKQVSDQKAPPKKKKNNKKKK
ncbi:sulfatase-like hydrolase/transferase [Lentisphaera marina]|uniref:sulfatase-like hydrolase/transferase n=1 Tax=Lentisphaera marina TaxID=1111041 RepID=UPI00236539AB|nr:sulfatase-like hydrolase/transferase [Lentisphaera marina]MDD7985564.1 sulfatase-like hydrolase/transferase [Lentisphaera marina]